MKFSVNIKEMNLLKKFLLYSTIAFLCFAITCIFFIVKDTDTQKKSYLNDVREANTKITSSLSDISNDLILVTMQILDNSDTLFYLSGKKTDHETETRTKNSISTIVSRYYVSGLIICDKKNTLPLFTYNNKSILSYDDIYQVLNAYKSGFKFSSFENQSNSRTITYTCFDYRGFYLTYLIQPYIIDDILKQNANDYDNYVYSGNICLCANTDSNFNIDELDFTNDTNSLFTDKNAYIVTTFTNNINVISVLDSSKVTKKALASVSTQSKAFCIVMLVVFCILIFMFVIITSLLKNSETSKNNNKIKRIMTNLVSKKTLTEEDILFLVEFMSNVSYFRCVLLQFDNIPGSTEINIVNSVQRDIEAAVEFSSSNCTITANCSFLQQNSMGILFSSTQSIDCSFVNNFLDKISNKIKNRPNISLFSVIGDEFENASQIPEQIDLIIDYSICKFITGYNSRIHIGDMDYLKEDAEYPTEIEKSIIESVCKCDYQNSYDNIDRFVLLANELNPIIAKKWLMTLAFSLAKYADSHISFNTINQLAQCNTISESVRILESLIPTEIPNSTFCNNTFKATVLKLIEQNYTNYDFNLGFLSELTQMSTTYLGRKFKQEFDTTFNDFLAKLRIEKSKDLLLDFSKSIEDISMNCGFNSASYFIKIFKKHTSMTPTEYRVWKSSKNIEVK